MMNGVTPNLLSSAFLNPLCNYFHITLKTAWGEHILNAYKEKLAMQA